MCVFFSFSFSCQQRTLPGTKMINERMKHFLFLFACPATPPVLTVHFPALAFGLQRPVQPNYWSCITTNQQVWPILQWSFAFQQITVMTIFSAAALPLLWCCRDVLLNANTVPSIQMDQVKLKHKERINPRLTTWQLRCCRKKWQSDREHFSTYLTLKFHICTSYHRTQIQG